MHVGSGGIVALALVIAVPLQAQVAISPSLPTTPASGAAPAPANPDVARQLILRRDTPIHLMVMSEVSTKERSAGFRFKLRVNEPVTVSGTIVVPVGTTAYGEVTSAESSGNVGKSGRLSARLLHIDIDGRAIGLTGETRASGKSGTGEVVVGVLGLGLLGLFAKGNNAKIKAGELMTGFTTEDTTFDSVSPASAAAVSAPASPTASALPTPAAR